MLQFIYYQFFCAIGSVEHSVRSLSAIAETSFANRQRQILFEIRLASTIAIFLCVEQC